MNRYDLSTEALGVDWNCGSGADGECGMNERGGVALGEDVFFFLFVSLTINLCFRVLKAAFTRLLGLCSDPDSDPDPVFTRCFAFLILSFSLAFPFLSNSSLDFSLLTAFPYPSVLSPRPWPHFILFWFYTSSFCLLL